LVGGHRQAEGGGLGTAAGGGLHSLVNGGGVDGCGVNSVGVAADALCNVVEQCLRTGTGGFRRGR
jgi:hypothetical protein